MVYILKITLAFTFRRQSNKQRTIYLVFMPKCGAVRENPLGFHCIQLSMRFVKTFCAFDGWKNRESRTEKKWEREWEENSESTTTPLILTADMNIRWQAIHVKSNWWKICLVESIFAFYAENAKPPIIQISDQIHAALIATSRIKSKSKWLLLFFSVQLNSITETKPIDSPFQNI